MLYLRKFPKFLKYFSFTLVGTSAGWIYYQIWKTQEILNNALDTSILMKPLHKEEKKHMQFLEFETLKAVNSNVISRTWNTLKFTYASRLISLANSENETIRLKAVEQLAKVRNLDDWHCSILSDRIGAHTAVGLARLKNVDSRFFKPPPYRLFACDNECLTNEMKDLLIELHNRSQHSCMGYFISKVFVDEHDVGRIVDHDSSTMELSKFIQRTTDILPMCLESLLHHANIQKYAKDIVTLNGLPLLMDIHKKFIQNTEVSVTLCNIISALSLFPDLLEPIFKSGWITILAEWAKNEEVRLSSPAAKALANFDRDDAFFYPRRLYLLYPMMRPAVNFDADVVFVHGLLGGVFYTWRQRNKSQEAALGFIGKELKTESLAPDTSAPKPLKRHRIPTWSDPDTMQYFEHLEDINSDCEGSDYEVVWEDIPENIHIHSPGPYTCPGHDYNAKKADSDCYTYCWPRDWLPEDCCSLRIIGINYDTSLSMWASMCPSENLKPTLEERSTELMDSLKKAGLGTKPIIWVTHSMGGLIVKNILCKAYENTNCTVRNICLNTKGIVFYSTPHRGSRLANLSQATALVLWPSVEVQELRENSPQLLNLHKKFLEIVEEVPMKIVTFVETKATVVTALKFNFLLVEPKSGNTDIGEYYEVPQDHLGICKPVNRYSFLYQRVLHMIRDVVKESRGN